MRKLIFSALAVIAVTALAAGVTYSVFSDTETSNDNTFAAGTLDLKIDGGDVNVSHSFTNMEPVHSQPNFHWTLKNAGTKVGYLNLKNISVTSDENACNDPETDAGDVTCGDPGEGEGELASVLNYRLMVDNNCDGWLQAGDTVIFQGMADTMADHYDQNIKLNPGEEVCINSLVNWWSTADDNKAQGDSMTANFGFELDQDPI